MENAATLQPGYRSNQLLAALPREEADRLLAGSRIEQLDARQPIFEPYEVLETVYFPLSGMCSLLTTMLDGDTIEMATIGCEGMVGVPMITGSGTAGNMRGMYQVAGESIAVNASQFKQELARGGRLSTNVSEFIAALFTLVGQNAACNRLHTINQRLARWLLMTHDRLGVNQFNLTHELMAQMLGSRRASVTEAAAWLQSAGAIRYKRAEVSVLDRTALEESSCECYAVIDDAYANLYAQDAMSDA